MNLGGASQAVNLSVHPATSSHIWVPPKWARLNAISQEQVMSRVIRPFDRDAIRAQYRSAKPFPFFKIDDFIDESLLDKAVAAYPTYDEARGLGREFSAVNEKLKIQVTDSANFPSPVKSLADELSGPGFLSDLEYITGIPNLLPDPTYNGGGMHLSGSSGRLDVHVDFNFQEDTKLFRRLNILVYLNPVWEESWGGKIELWDKDVAVCQHSFSPILNRCVVFETSETSFHGVTPIKCPAGHVRKSFAAYYYTREAPPWWRGKAHSTVFKARPDERFRGAVLMPAENLKRGLHQCVGKAKSVVKRLLGRS
jgi:2OG-Fe(II) oxygenase superfamily